MGMRYCKDLGLWAIDRPVVSCRHRTAFCGRTCYNQKFYKGLFRKSMERAEPKLAPYWDSLTSETFRTELSRKRIGTKARFRFCTRGETFSVPADVKKVSDIANGSPDILFWVPTRAWRSNEIRPMLESLPKNVRPMLSVDPSNSIEELETVRNSGHPAIFYGDDSAAPGGFEWVKCPKTWNGQNGACANCSFCFDGNTNVWLKKH